MMGKVLDVGRRSDYESKPLRLVCASSYVAMYESIPALK